MVNHTENRRVEGIGDDHIGIPDQSHEFGGAAVDHLLIAKIHILLPYPRQMGQGHQRQAQIPGGFFRRLPGFLPRAQQIAQNIVVLSGDANFPVPLFGGQQQHRVRNHLSIFAAHLLEVCHAALFPQGQPIQPGGIGPQLFQEFGVQGMARHAWRIGKLLNRLRHEAQGHGVQSAVIVSRSEFIPNLIAAANEAVVIRQALPNGLRGKDGGIMGRSGGKSIVRLPAPYQSLPQFLRNFRGGRSIAAPQLFRAGIGDVFQHPFREALPHPAAAVGKGQLLRLPARHGLDGPHQRPGLQLAAGVAVFMV